MEPNRGLGLDQIADNLLEHIKLRNRPNKKKLKVKAVILTSTSYYKKSDDAVQ